MRGYRLLAVLGAVAFGHGESAVVGHLRLASTGTIDGSTGAGQLMAAEFVPADRLPSRGGEASSPGDPSGLP